MNTTQIRRILARAVTEAGDRQIVLNLYCCQGSSAAGYAAAGFFVIGVDLNPQPRYPYPFIQADAIWFLTEFAAWIREHAALVDASPPCQRYSKAQRIQGRAHPDLIGPTRAALQAVGVPYVIENVEEARPELRDPAMLCGAMFPGLHTYRHRLIETSFPLALPEHPKHAHDTVKMGRALREGDWYHAVGNFSNVPYVKADMGVPWMSRDGIRECIPPVYTRLIGEQFLARQTAQAAA